MFVLLPQFCKVFLAFAADFLFRVNEIRAEVRELYVQSLDAPVRQNFEVKRHCMFSFLVDTTSLRLLDWFHETVMTKRMLFNMVIGQTFVPDHRLFLSLIHI